MMNLINKILILFMITILSGCASITESKNQSMSVTTGDVTGAMCTLANSKGSYYVTTPGSVMVRNACDQLSISCTKEGYVPANPAAGTVQDKAKNMAWGNLVFGGIIGIIMGISAGNLVSFIFKIPAVIPLDWAIIGLAVCSLIGIGFGIYPAWKAAQLDPIESLRFE